MPKNNNNKETFCFRCYHIWKRRKKDEMPKVCPKCKNRYWNRPRKKIGKKVITEMVEMFIGIHGRIIENSGGIGGVREDGGIYNSTNKLLNHQFKNKKNPMSLGAFALNEFAKRHYFNDGNKRTGYAIAKILMLVNRCHIQISYRDATKFIIRVAEYGSKVSFEEIRDWIEKNCKQITDKELENYLSRSFMNLMLGDEEDE